MLRRSSAAGIVAFGLLFTSVTDLSACGDKFLRAGRSARQNNYAPMHPATILLYQSAKSKPKVVQQWQGVLKKAGHKPLIVQAGDDLARAVSEESYDVIIADYFDAGRLSTALRAVPSKPGVLPVLTRPTRALVEDATREYQFLINGDTAERRDVLVAIDRLMEFRQKATLAATAGR